MTHVPQHPARLADVQGQQDERKVSIDKVGVSNLRHPIVLLDRARERQHSIATMNMFVELPHQFKGTHMSRFLEVLNDYNEISHKSIRHILQRMLDDLDAETAHLEMSFPYFLRKEAPVSRSQGTMEYTCGFEASRGRIDDFVMWVDVPVTTVCPCSKEIAERGAHNQRGQVNIAVRTNNFVWFEELIERAEGCASCALYPVLKRPDEKWVTEHAYDNPRFAEDLLREVAVLLRDDARIDWYRIVVENQESIHAHNAYASLERWK